MVNDAENILTMVLSRWIYSTHCYNVATFGDSVATCCIGIKIFRNDDTDYALDSRYQPNDYENISQRYEHCINVKHNTPVKL